MPRAEIASGDTDDLAARLADALRRRVGIGFEINFVAPGSLARGDIKVRRWKDNRIHRLES